MSEITKPRIYPLHLLKSLFLLPVPQVAQKSHFIAERCQNFKQAPSLSAVSLSFLPLIPGRLGCGRLLTLTCFSTGIMLAFLSLPWVRKVRGVMMKREEKRRKSGVPERRQRWSLRWKQGVCVRVPAMGGWKGNKNRKHWQR